jgi:uncharacterized protein (AIM24 family)
MFQEYQETTGQDPFTLQNKKLLKIHMQYGPVNARTGSMVAYQGDVRFENTGSGGLNKLIKSKVTGEGVSMMQCTGTGELFVADMASEIQVFYLENDTISCNGASVLAFSGSIEWDIQRIGGGGAGMMAGGMYNVTLRGTGYVALTTKGEPVVLDVSGPPTFADPNAVVFWTSGVQINVRTDTGGLKSLMRGGTGELFQLGFSGQGYVMVQPAENVQTGGGQSAGGGGGLLGGIMGQ